MHSRFRSCALVFVLSISVWIAFGAQALGIVGGQRTFVSAQTGNDANSCGPTSPCRTFSYAVTQTAPGGEVIVLDSGGYGPFTISQSVSIVAPTGVYAGITAFSGDAITVSAGATDKVILRGLTLMGLGGTNGIHVVAVGNLFVEGCVIANFAGSGNQGNGLYFASSGRLSVKDTTVRGNDHVGIWVGPASGTATATVEHCRSEANSHGVVSSASSVMTVRDTVASQNSDTGFDAESGELNLEGCVSAHNYGSNGNGILSLGVASLVRVSNTTVTDNRIGIYAVSGNILSRGNNTVEGNGPGGDGAFTGTYSSK
jgi:Right handed beta helix region